MVRAMNLRMTIEAAAAQEECAGAAAWQALRCRDDGRVPDTLVAALAQKGRPYFQERRLRRAVRIVAIAAVLRDRLVLP